MHTPTLALQFGPSHDKASVAIMSVDYFIRVASKEDTADIVSLIEGHFYPEETILQSYLGMNRDRITPEDRKFMRECSNKVLEFLLNENTSLVAVERSSDRIIGCFIMVTNENRKFYPPKEMMSKVVETEVMRSKFTSELFYYLDLMSGKQRVFEAFPEARRALKLSFLSVDKNHRRKSVGSELMRECLEWGEKNGFEVAYATFSSAHARRAAEKLGFKSIEDHDLSYFKNFEDGRIFADFEPDSTVRVMAVRLKN